MVKKLINCVVLFVVAVLFSYSSQSVNVARAAGIVLFEESFDNHEGSVPPEWQTVDADGSGIASNFVVDNGRMGMEINQGSVVGEIVAGDVGWNNYIYEFDMISFSGSDRNVIFRWQDDEHRLGFHITGGQMFLEKLIPVGEKGGPDNPVPAPVVNIVGKLPHNMVHHFTITLEGRRIIIHLKNDLVDETLIDFDDVNKNAILNGKIGLRIGTGSNFPASVWFDNVVVTSIDNALDVPFYAQTDQPWGDETYDHAPDWNDGGHPDTIGTWGCALTNTAMILNYHGFNAFKGQADDGFADGVQIDPGSLNSWLNTQPDSAWRNGLVNWETIARLTREIRDASGSAQTLEWKRIETSDFSDIEQGLDQGIPDILTLNIPESPSGIHFAVAKGKNDSGYLVNDPFYTDSELVSSSSAVLKKIDRYVLSNSNFSYLVVHADLGVNPLLVHEGGARVGRDEQQEYEEQSGSWYMLGNPINGYEGESVALAGDDFHEIGIPTPSNGNYQLQLMADETGFYEFEIYGYDQDAEPVVSKQKRFLSEDAPLTLGMDYTQIPGNNVFEPDEDVNFDRLANSVKFLHDNGEIGGKFLRLRLVGLVKLADRFYPNNPKLTTFFLARFGVLLEFYKGQGISEQAYELLMSELGALKSSL